MKIGYLEIGVVLFVAFSVALIFRLLRGDRRLAAQGRKDLLEVSPHREPAASKRQFKIAGFVFVVVGIAVLFLGMRTFEFVMKLYIWAFVLVGVGIVALLLSRRD